MRILHVLHRYLPVQGGAETYLHEIGRRLVSDGHQVVVYTTDVRDVEGFWRRGMRRVPPDAASRIDGVEVKRFRVTVLPGHRHVARLLGMMPSASLRSFFDPPGPWLPGLARHSRRDGPFDLINASSYPGLMLVGSRVAREHRAALILTPHIHLGEPGNRQLARPFLAPHVLELYNSANRVFVLTEIERRALAQAGVEASRIVVTKAGVDPSRVLGGRGDRFRVRHGISPGAAVVTQLSIKTYDKGITHTVGAMERVWRRNEDARLVLAGGTTASFERFYKACAPETRLRCLSLDSVSEEEKRDLLSATDVLVMPSRVDSFGLAFLEGWVYGKPVVGAAAGGVPEVIEDGVDGFLVPFGDEVSLARRISSLLDDAGLARRLGERGRQKVLAHLTWDALYPAIKAAYESLSRQPECAR